MDRVWWSGIVRASRISGIALLMFGGRGATEAAGQAEEIVLTTGHAQVVAQGVVALPEGDVAWRAVRGRAGSVADAPFAARPLGFVLATGEALLLADGETGEQARLGPGEAALVLAGTMQRRASAGDGRTNFLAIELLPTASGTDAGAGAEEGSVQLAGEPFQAPTGLRDLDLVRDVLSGEETYDLPDTGQQSVILATAGAIVVTAPGGETATLLAGEGGTFVGEATVGTADGEGDGAFVVAVIGPEVEVVEVAPAATATPPPASDPPSPTEVANADGDTEEANDATATSTAGDAETGTITVQVFACPSGMRPETLAAAACSSADGEEFDVTLAGDELDGPLTLSDAGDGGGESDGGGAGATSYTFADLPFGSYRLAQAVPPAGYDTYTVSAAETSGDPEAGYILTLAADLPDLVVRIYNFAAEDEG